MMFVSAPVWHMRRREFVTLLGSALVAAPNIARSQPGNKIPTGAHLCHAGNPKAETPSYEVLLEGSSTVGYVDGANFRLLHRFTNETPERFTSMAAELAS